MNNNNSSNSRANIIEYSNCQFTKKRVIAVSFTVITLIIGTVFLAIYAGCNDSNQCSDGTEIAFIIIGTFSLFIGFTALVVFTFKLIFDYLYENNPSFKGMVDSQNLEREIQNKLKNKSEEQLNSIKEFIDNQV